jgi:hypothetical protein
MRYTFLALALCTVALAQPPADVPGVINTSPKPVASDSTVKLDYDIVYVRAPRKGDNVGTNWAEISNPVFMDAGADLMLLHPDGSEEVLVKGGKGSVTDPVISFDGEWVYYSLFHDLTGASVTQGPAAGADIYKLHIKSRKTVRLTTQQFTPNTGAANWSSDFRTPEPGKDRFEYGVFNTGPCPLPGGKVMFTSNRNGYKPPKRLPHMMQLFVMDDDGANVECVGHLNLGGALHPTVLRDGRVMFSSLESQGLRTSTLWGLWVMNPDGTEWAPLASAFLTGVSPSAWHFQTQLSDGSIVAEEYYNQTSSGFGSFVQFPPNSPYGKAFGPANVADDRNPPLRHGRTDDGKARLRRYPFSPFGIESITPFARADEGAADFAERGKRYGTRVGKVTHPSAAPDNHLLMVWSIGPVNGGYTVDRPAVDGGIYLLKGGKPANEPGDLLLIKNDPKFNEQWPRAVVPYKRVHGVDEPKKHEPLANDGKLSKHLPAGTPFGLVGTSSFYKRESYPNGTVKPGTTVGAFAGGASASGYEDLDPFNSRDDLASSNWIGQGADAGRYTNADIHAVRIVAMEPNTDRNKGPNSGRTFRSHANEKLRILGEIPLRKFKQPTPPAPLPEGKGEEEVDPDGNPDTSFLAKIPADVGFTFQTLDKRGMVLNVSQTWHQLRPGEIRHDCGGCHAHSQKPTEFARTAAAKPDYAPFDLTQQTPLLTTKAADESKRKWDAKDETGVAFAKGAKDVEFWRDVKPILERSCVACHTEKGGAKAAGNLVLDDIKTINVADCDDVPGTYYRLAMDFAARFGHKPVNGSWRGTNASRYIRMFQSRRSLLVWKVYGERLDGWTNDDFPTETTPGNSRTLAHKREAVPDTVANRNRADLDFTGSAMPPPDAVKSGKVQALSAEDKLTLVRWIDLGCPIDLTFDPKNPAKPGFGWMLDDQRPALAVSLPKAGTNPPLERFLIGMHDYRTGLDANSFVVTADFAVNGAPAGTNLAPKFAPLGGQVFELKLSAPLTVARGTLTVSVKDKQGNVTRVERTFGAK